MNQNRFEAIYQELHELRLANPKQALLKIEKFLLEPLTQKQRILLKLDKAYCLWILSRVDDSYLLYSEILEQTESYKMQEEYAIALTGMAMMDGDKGEYQMAIKNLEQAIAIFQSIANIHQEANATNRLAVIHYNHGNYDEAQRLFQKTVRLSEQNDQMMYIHALNNLALINHERGKIKTAVRNFGLCLEMAREMNYSRAICIMQNNYADALQDIGDFKEAQKNYEEGLEFARKLEDVKNIALLSASYAQFLIERGELNKAGIYFEESLRFYEGSDEKTQYINALNGYARFWLFKGLFKKALQFLDKALEIISETGLYEPEIDTLILKAEVHEALDDSQEAYKCLKKATARAWTLKTDIGRAKVLIERGRINIRFLNLDEAEILLSEGLYLANRSLHLKLEFKALILLANIYVLKYQAQKSNHEYYDLAMEKLQKVKQRAKEIEVMPEFINASIVQAMLSSVNGEFEVAEALLSKVMKIAEDKGLTVQVRHAQNRLMLISQTLEQKESQYLPELDQITLSAVLEDIQRVITAYNYTTLSPNDIKSIFLLTYKVDEIFGPTLLSTFNVDPEDQRYREQINMVGSLYIVSLGQGHRYHEGLFGPFPFGTSNLKSLVYSKILFDQEQENGRNKGMVYFLFCIVYPPKTSPYFYNRKRIQNFLKSKLKVIKSVQDVNKGFLRKTYHLMIDEIFQNEKLLNYKDNFHEKVKDKVDSIEK